MSRIKSAWEIALEKTKDIKVDEKQLKTQEEVREGMALVGKYLNNPDLPADAFAAELSKVGKDSLQNVKKGIFDALLANIALPSDSSYALRFDRLCLIAAQLNKEAGLITEQLKTLFERYFTEREAFVENIRQQLQAAMQQNPEQIDSSQFSQIIEQNLKALDEQYRSSVNQAKEQLQSIKNI